MLHLYGITVGDTGGIKIVFLAINKSTFVRDTFTGHMCRTARYLDGRAGGYTQQIYTVGWVSSSRAVGLHEHRIVGRVGAVDGYGVQLILYFILHNVQNIRQMRSHPNCPAYELYLVRFI